MTLKTLIVDNHDYFRETLRQYLSGFDTLDVKAEARDGKEAVKIAKILKPDLMLIEAVLPELSGIEAAQLIKKHNPDTRIILFSMNDLGFYEKIAGDQFNMMVPKDKLFEELPGLTSKIVQSFERDSL